jgi:hypothetical protein
VPLASLLASMFGLAIFLLDWVKQPATLSFQGRRLRGMSAEGGHHA